MAYGIHDLKLTGLRVKTILSVHISHKPGEHGVMELTADMGESNMDLPVHETESGQSVALFGKKDGRQELLFCGVITKLTSEIMGRSCHVKLTARTWSYLMDIKKKSRSFQDTSMTYGALVHRIVKEYPGAECQILFADMPLGEIAVQYQETDWQFLKRVLSARHIPIVCSEVRDSLCVYAGVARIPSRMKIISTENIWKDMDELAYWKEIGENVSDTDFITYQMRLDNHMMLYAEVSYRGKDLTAGVVEYRTIGSTVYEFITLQKCAGILQKTIYPMQLVGTALEGRIVNVQGENVQIHLKIDDAYESNDCYWFPFSTPSASSDGSGWYCMPEKGDQVRVYFPSKKTGEVIAISAVSSYEAPAPVATAKKSESSPHGGSSEVEVIETETGDIITSSSVGEKGSCEEFGVSAVGIDKFGGAGVGIEKISSFGKGEIKSLGVTGSGIGAIKSFGGSIGRSSSFGEISGSHEPMQMSMVANDEFGERLVENSTTAGGGSSSGGNGSYSGGGSSSGGSGSSGGGGISTGTAGAGMAAGAASDTKAAEKEAGEDKMSDPSTKYLRTIGGQEVKLSPKGIVVSCSGGAVKVEVLKNGKINLYAEKGIQISAKQNIQMQAKRVLKVSCEKTAYLESSMGGSLYMDEKGNITIRGTEVHMN